MKGLLIALIVLMVVFTGQAFEHAYISRGITCELYYIQGQVDTAASLDYLMESIEKLPIDRKYKDERIDYLKRIKHYQMFVVELDGIKKCAKLDMGLLEILYFRTKSYFKQNKDTK